jgi:hypothetical protein
MTVIQGCSRRAAVELAQHITNAEKNERVWLFDARGTIISECLSGDLAKELGTLGRMSVEDHARMALKEMEALASGTQCTRPLYHLNIDPRAEDAAKMTPEQWRHCLETTEKVLGLTGHARFAMMHEKEGRLHMHVVWARINPDTGRAWHDGWNYVKHELAARQLERDLGHEKTPGVHVEREPGSPRPERRPEQWEMQQAAKKGMDLDAFRADIRDVRERCDGAQAFIAALKEQGRTVALGKRRDFVIVDERGGIHSLGRTLGERAPAVREFMAGIELPTEKQVRSEQRERAAGQAPVWSREAAQTEADKRLIDSAQNAARDAERRREIEAPRERVQKVLEALGGEPQQVWAAQQEQRVAFAYQAGKVFAVTSRHEFELSYEQGDRVVAQMNDARIREYAERKAAGEQVEPPEPLQRGHLPSVDHARRFAWSLEKTAELEQTVRAAFDKSVTAADTGIAFAKELEGRDITTKRDRAGRLHLEQGGRETNLARFITPEDQSRHLSGLLDDNARLERFTSAADRHDARRAKWERVQQEPAARASARTIRQTLRAPGRAASQAEAKLRPATRATTTAARGAERAVGVVVNAVSSLVNDFGKHQAYDAAAREAPAPEQAPAPAPSPAQERRARQRAEDVIPTSAAAREERRRDIRNVALEQQEQERRMREAELRRQEERDDDFGRERRR